MATSNDRLAAIAMFSGLMTLASTSNIRLYWGVILCIMRGLCLADWFMTRIGRQRELADIVQLINQCSIPINLSSSLNLLILHILGLFG